MNYFYVFPLQVNEPYYPFNASSVVDFDIGNDENCKVKLGYCNGPLKPGATYKVKIRAYTARDKFADTIFSHTITTGKFLFIFWKKIIKCIR